MVKTIDCPRCRQTLRAGTRFCTSCGLSSAQIDAETIEMTPRDTSVGGGAHTSDPLVGRVLDSKYQLIARLGEGGMGAVYRARRLHIGDEVAIKVLHHRLLLDESAVERFRREARSAAMISHPNVVTIHDFCEARSDGGPAYIVMELIRGASLRSLLKREGRLRPERAVSLMRDICAGVGLAHRQGVVHRDLKPDNVIVIPPAGAGEDEVAKVVDFGIAKLRDITTALTLTQTGAVMGTPYYMSPEQCRGEPLDPRSDVYSLGAMFYEMLAGAPPFRAGNLAGLISKHLHEAAPALPAGLGVKPALEAVCLRALSKKPEERQPDASALARDLQAAHDDAPRTADLQPTDPALSVETLRGGHANTPTVHHQPVASSPWKWVAAGLLALLVVAATGVSVVWYMSGADAAADRAADTTNVAPTITPAPTSQPGEDAASAEGAEAPPNTALDRAADEVADDASDKADGLTAEPDLPGEWTGNYGPLGQPATLDIKENKGGKFSGVLRQGAVRVAFTGSLNTSTRELTIKETRLLSGSGWSLGENTGTLSADGRKMTGTGSDPVGAQLGMSYEWSFSKRGGRAGN